MAIDPYFVRLHRWIEVDKVRILKLAGGEVSDEEVQTLPNGSDTMEIVFIETWLVWRIIDAGGAIKRSGMYPPWRVVEVRSDP